MPSIQYSTPGVYYERLDAGAPAISAIRTDVAGFVGLAVRGPLDTPVPIASWRQFEAHFGGFTGAGFLAYAVRAFFENGGRRCWVVRVASKGAAAGARAASVLVPGAMPPGLPAWRLAASSPGLWGNALSVTVREMRRAQALSNPAASTPEATAIHAASGFERFTMVRLSQDGAGPVYKVVSGVDPYAGRLLWVHPDPEARLSYDAPLSGFDPDRPLLVESVSYTLAVREAGRLAGLYEGLSLVPEHARYGPRVLPPLDYSEDFERQGALPPTPALIAIEEQRDLPLTDLKPLDVASAPTYLLDGGADGLTLLRPYDFMGEAADPNDSDPVRARKTRGFRALDLVDEVAAVALPDLHVQPVPPPLAPPLEPCIPDPCLVDEAPPPAQLPGPVRAEAPPVFSPEQIFGVQDALVNYCELRRDRIALLDPPVDAALDLQQGLNAVLAWRRRFDSEFAALYWPWLRVVEPLRRVGEAGRALTRAVPPSGHVAGQIARSDFEVGVHKAPANALLGWVQDVTLMVDDARHGALNTLGINVVRAVPGRGIRIMGARTLGRDTQGRFLNVRRLLMMIAKAVYLSMQWAVFEPNDLFTRAKVRLALTSFLLALWQRGALVGGTAEAAFFVACDEENNPAYERDRGRLLAEVGVAPSHPYEFVVLRVGRTDNEFEIRERSNSSGGA